MKSQALATFAVFPKIVLVSLGLSAGLAGCADAAEDSGGVPVALQTDLKAILDDAVARKITPGVGLHVADAGGATWSAAAGVRDVQTSTAMTSEDHFRAGSIIKTFVASAVLQAVEAGNLRLDEVITARLPAEVTHRIDHADKIQIEMLLRHRSGIPDWVTGEVHQAAVTDPAHIWTLDDILRQVEKQQPAFEPGERFEYSNTNYILLAEILQGISGRSWREVVREQVIAKAALEHTTLPDPGDLECPAPCAHGYVPVAGELLDATRIDPSMAGASGSHALITTSADLSLFLKDLRRGALFTHAGTLEAMFAFQPAPDPESRLTDYGLGVMQLNSNGNIAHGHIGGSAGYQAFMLYVPATDRYVSGFINVLGDFAAVLEPVLARVAKP